MCHKLEVLFSASSRARVMDLHLLLQTSKKGDLSIEDYILRIEMIVDYLAVVGQPSPDHDHVFYAFGGLDSN